MSLSTDSVVVHHSSDVGKLLSDWGFGHLIARFEDEEISIEALKEFEYRMLNGLVPKAGPRALLWKKLQEWQFVVKSSCVILDENNTGGHAEIIVGSLRTQNGTSLQSLDEFTFIPVEVATETSTTSGSQLVPIDIAQIDTERTIGAGITEQAIVQQPVPNNSNCDIKNSISDLCKSDIEIKTLLNTHDSGSLTADDRQHLCKLIIKDQLHGNPEKQIRPERMAQLAVEICQIFTKEDPLTYFIPRRVIKGVSVAPKGKLYHSYSNLTKFFRKHGVRRSIRDKRDASNLASDDDVDCNDTDLEEDIIWLSTRSEPWSSVEVKWRATADLRLSRLRKEDEIAAAQKRRKTNNPSVNQGKISAYVNEFKGLRLNAGYTLLELDFLKLHPQCDLKLASKWEQFSQIQSLSPADDVANVSEVAIFKKFAKLFTSTTLNMSGGFKKRLTKVEIVEGFILHVKVIVDLKPALLRMREKASQLKTTVQPLPVVIGLDATTISDSYVVVDDIFYKVEAPLRAVDVCFKCFHALHADYPKQSIGPWLLLQQAVYDIKTEWDGDIPQVIELRKKFQFA